MGQQLGINEAVAAHLRAKQRAKRAYEVADAQLAAILKEAEPGDCFILGKSTTSCATTWPARVKVWHGTTFPATRSSWSARRKKSREHLRARHPAEQPRTGLPLTLLPRPGQQPLEQHEYEISDGALVYQHLGQMGQA
jgi:hypothetical protein